MRKGQAFLVGVVVVAFSFALASPDRRRPRTRLHLSAVPA